MWSGSLRLDSSLSDDRSPLFEVVRDSVAESIRRTRFYIHALRLQSCSSFRIMQYFGQLSIQTGDNGLRHGPWNDYRHPEHSLISGKSCFGDRGQFWEHDTALSAGCRQRLHLSTAYKRKRWRNGGELHVKPASH